MKYNLIYILLLLTFCVGCEKTWDDHYGYEDDPRIAAASLTAWEVLNLWPEEYSKFITLIERAGYDKALNSNRMLTVWAPKNEYIPDEVMEYAPMSEDVKRFVKNHLNSLPLFKTKIAGREKINTLAGKSLVLFYDYRTERTYIDDMHIYRFDIACTNGVIHEIGGILKPLQNLDEFLQECGPDYSLFRDSMNGRVTKEFNAEESFPIGVNDLGQTVYDSVFDTENSLLRFLELDDEEMLRTLCIPSNAVIHEAFEGIQEYMVEIKRPFTKVDSATCFEWIMKASILNGKVEDYSYSPSYYSAFGSEIRPSKQLVRSQYEECSNGNVYFYEDLYLPRSIFMYNIETSLVNLLEIDKSVNAEMNIWDNAGQFILFDGNNTKAKFLSVGGEIGDYLEFRPISINIYSEPQIIKLMPGKYAVYGQFFGYGGSSSTKLKINGESQKWYKDGGESFPTSSIGHFEYTTYPILVDTLHIKPHHGYSAPVIRFEALEKAPIRIQRLKFQAVGKDNY